jgi:bifunctional non-homologous end joining protein LigD
VEALAGLPAGTVVDGEVVAIDKSGRPNFNLLQNFRAEASRIQYYVFDLLCWKDRDLTRVPLIERRALLKRRPDVDSWRTLLETARREHLQLQAAG